MEVSQFEINGKFKIIAMKAESTKARKGEEPDYRAKETDVLGFINTVKGMIQEVNNKIHKA